MAKSKQTLVDKFRQSGSEHFALIPPPDTAETRTEAPAAPAAAADPAAPVRIPIAAIRIKAGFNARHPFVDDDPDLDDLRTSLQLHGMINPILVFQTDEDPEAPYLVVAGERRLRAARSLGWTEIPATVRRGTMAQAEAVMLAENLHRKDLTLAETATGYRRLQDHYGWTQAQIATYVGVSQSWVSSILKIAETARLTNAVAEGRITVTAARIISRLLHQGTEIVAGSVDWVLDRTTVEHWSEHRLRQEVQYILTHKQVRGLTRRPKPDWSQQLEKDMQTITRAARHWSAERRVQTAAYYQQLADQLRQMDS